MSRSVSIDEMAAAINEGLEEYADLSAQGVKSAVRKSAKAVKEQINSSAPVRTGRYAKSWAWNRPCTAQAGICFRICWKRGMPNEAAEGFVPFRISRPLRRWGSRCWKG